MLFIFFLSCKIYDKFTFQLCYIYLLNRGYFIVNMKLQMSCNSTAHIEENFTQIPLLLMQIMFLLQINK